MKVKGSVLVDFIKTIRADKSGVYEPYLTDEDKKIIGQRILPSAWYPYETFKHCFQAVFEILAKGDPEKVREWGRSYGGTIMSGLYKGLLKQGEPMQYLKKYSTYIRNFFDFGAIEVKELSDNEVEMTIKDFDAEFVPAYYIMFGWLERTLEICGAKDIKSEVLERAWEGAPVTRIRISWKK
jgi:uncharacterized protein (TIGR02265 family)